MTETVTDERLRLFVPVSTHPMAGGDVELSVVFAEYATFGGFTASAQSTLYHNGTECPVEDDLETLAEKFGMVVLQNAERSRSVAINPTFISGIKADENNPEVCLVKDSKGILAKKLQSGIFPEAFTPVHGSIEEVRTQVSQAVCSLHVRLLYSA